jgi:hypothetical protein
MEFMVIRAMVIGKVQGSSSSVAATAEDGRFKVQGSRFRVQKVLSDR